MGMSPQQWQDPRTRSEEIPPLHVNQIVAMDHASIYMTQEVPMVWLDAEPCLLLSNLSVHAQPYRSKEKMVSNKMHDTEVGAIFL